MPIQRLTRVAAFASLLLCAVSAHAVNRDVAHAAADGVLASPLSLNSSPLFSPSYQLPESRATGFAGTMPAFQAGHGLLLAPAASQPAADDAVQPEEGDESPAQSLTDLRKALIGLAMHLRDTRYVRGGRSPVSGFDCSGFVRYVFAHAIGVQLPANSASQFLAGLKVKRADLKPGDLVFFHTSGRRQRITHVGIYLSDGRFIHAPTVGKAVQISSLGEAYWAKRFVGAKRPTGMLALAEDKG